MGRKSVSFEKKVEIAALLKVLPNHSDVARRAKVSRKCVINVAEKMKNRESLENRSGQGRRRLTTNTDDQSLQVMAKRDRTQSLRVLAQKWGAAIGKDVSKNTVSRRLRAGGLNSYVQKRKPFRNRGQKTTRRDWCDRMQLWTKEQWARVIWSDESHFQLINSLLVHSFDELRRSKISGTVFALVSKAAVARSASGHASPRLVQARF
jgi:transposase